MSDICIIPARAGSQRVKDKNFRKFSKNGCSLLDTKIKHAKACFDPTLKNPPDHRTINPEH